MSWFKVDDAFSEHAKVDALAGDQALAIACWALCGSACARRLTDGLVTRVTLERALISWSSKDRARAAGALVRVGLWEVVDEGWRYHDWDRYQPSRTSVESRREDGRRRKAEHVQRRRGRVTEIVLEDPPSRDGNALPDALPSRPVTDARPDPTRPDPILASLGSRARAGANQELIEHLHSESRRAIGRAWFGVLGIVQAWDGGGMRAVHADVDRVRAVIEWAQDPDRTGNLEPKAAITRAVEGYAKSPDRLVRSSNQSFGLFASDPARWLKSGRALSSAPGDFSKAGQRVPSFLDDDDLAPEEPEVASG